MIKKIEIRTLEDIINALDHRNLSPFLIDFNSWVGAHIDERARGKLRIFKYMDPKDPYTMRWIDTGASHWNTKVYTQAEIEEMIETWDDKKT